MQIIRDIFYLKQLDVILNPNFAIDFIALSLIIEVIDF